MPGPPLCYWITDRFFRKMCILLGVHLATITGGAALYSFLETTLQPVLGNEFPFIFVSPAVESALPGLAAPGQASYYCHGRTQDPGGPEDPTHSLQCSHQLWANSTFPSDLAPGTLWHGEV